MSRYVVLLPGDEARWAAASEEDRAATYARHGEFAERLAAGGHRVVGGAELAPSRETKQVRADAQGVVTVTDGPYAETVEQLTGYYEVETDDLDGLLEIAGLLATPEGPDRPSGVVEVRGVAGGTEPSS